MNTVNDVNSLVDKPWHLYFDGSRSNEGAGVGCMLLHPAGNKFILSCRLEFICINNTAEYEALIQGLKKALDLKVKVLIALLDRSIIPFIVYLITYKVTKGRYGI